MPDGAEGLGKGSVLTHYTQQVMTGDHDKGSVASDKAAGENDEGAGQRPVSRGALLTKTAEKGSRR